jgi:hypothetical protein
MESLFAPTNRLRDLYRARERDDDDDENDDFSVTEEEIDNIVELELVTGSLADAFLYRGFRGATFIHGQTERSCG